MSRPHGYAALLSLILAVPTWAAAQTPEDESETSNEPNTDGSDASDGGEVKKRGGLGLAPGTLQTANLATKPTAVTSTSTDAYEFKFSGFLRAPFRLGFQKGNTAPYQAGIESETVDPGTKIHSPPQIPDGNYTDWRYTNNLSGPWAELHFAYGNDRVSAHVILGAYNFTQAGYRDLQAQLGINQAFITMDFPRAFGRFGGLTWNVGGFANAYGASGRYDAGRYDTYLMGRTQIAGETLTAYLDVHPELRLTIEHGIGAKLQAPPYIMGAGVTPPYLPYPGEQQQGTTLVHHAHVGLTYREKVTLSGHYMTTWTDDAKAELETDGRITITGMDLRLVGGVYGDGYIGYAHMDARDVLRLQQAVEVLHSYSGWSFRDNFFPNSPTGTGTVDSILFQYTYSLSTLLRHPEPFWGQGPDVVLGAFGTVSWVTPDTNLGDMFPKTKSKFGGDVTYTMLSWLGAAVRYDVVNPNMLDSTQSFSVLSPRLIIRTDFVTHEQVVLQYTKYFYGDSVVAAWPHNTAAFLPDEHAVMIQASMWW